MRSLTVSGQTVFLLHYAPNWDSSFDCEFSLLNDSDRGLTGREERVPLSTTLRAGLTFDLLLQRQQAAEFRAALKALGNTPVLCPFWPAAALPLVDVTNSHLMINIGHANLTILQAHIYNGMINGRPSYYYEDDDSLIFFDGAKWKATGDGAWDMGNLEIHPENPSTAYLPPTTGWGYYTGSGEEQNWIILDDIQFFSGGDVFWQDQIDAFHLSSGLMLCYEPNWSQFSVYAAGGAPSFTPSLQAVKVPLLWGRFAKPPVPEAVTDELLAVTVEFIENSPVELAFTAAALEFTDGPEAAGQVRKLFPLRPDWRDGIKFGEVSVDINTSEIGYGRQTADVFYPQTGARIAEQKLLCKSWADIHTLIRFFYDAAGTVNNFWLPAFIGDCRLSVSVAPGSGSIIIDNAEGLGAASHLALINRAGIETHKVAVIDTVNNTVELTDPLIGSFNAADTLVSPLLLARFGKSSLKISFETDEIATASVRFIEVPEEYATIEGDEPGAQDKTAFLYRFTLTGFDSWLFTSHESAITHGANIYTPAHFDHGSIKENINLEKNELTITSRYFWHATDVSLRNPLGYFLPFRLEAPLRIEIMECYPDDAGNIAAAQTVFSGQVSTAAFEGPRISAKCQSIGSIFDRQIPTVLIQPTCNYALYGVACGVDPAIWKMAATVISYSGGHELIIATPVYVDQQAARPAHLVFEHFFAGGKMEAGSGDGFERRSILDAVANGDNIKLAIRHPLEHVPESIFLWPGCDGRKETCKVYNADTNAEGKFDNYRRFGGFPFVPIGNPTLMKVTKDQSQGGKK